MPPLPHEWWKGLFWRRRREGGGSLGGNPPHPPGRPQMNTRCIFDTISCIMNLSSSLGGKIMRLTHCRSLSALLGVGGGGFVEDLWRTSSSSNTWGQIWIHLLILTMKSVRIFTLRCLEEAMWAMEPWFVISFTVVKSWFFVSFRVFKSWFCWNK